MVSNYRNSNLKIIAPVILGFLIGVSIHFKTSIPQVCKDNDLKKSQKTNQLKRANRPTENPSTVKAKPNRFNNDFRPYFVYSELGFKDFLFIAVKISEQQLLSSGIAINNTWLSDFQNVVFFTPYSRDEEFHNRFIKKMNLNVVQLPDIVENSSDLEFSNRILQYMKDHYINKYNWFILVSDKVYINSISTLKFLKSLNSTMEIVVTNTNEKNTCDANNGVIFSHSALSRFSMQSCNIVGSFSNMLSSCLNNHGISCVSNLHFRINYANK